MKKLGGWRLLRQRRESPDKDKFSNINCSAWLMATKLHCTTVLPQYVGYCMCTNSRKANPRKVFRRPPGRGLLLF